MKDFSPKTRLDNYYLITTGSVVIPLGDSKNLNKDYFRLIGGVHDADSNVVLKEMTVEDLRKDTYGDIWFGNNYDYVLKRAMPKEVVELLNNVLSERGAIQKDNKEV